MTARDDKQPLQAALEEIRESLSRIESALASASAQQRAFDTLYAELKQYKEDFVFQAEKPLLLDILLFYDSLCWFRNTVKEYGDGPVPGELVSEALEYLSEELLELLARRDVLPIEPAEVFDGKVHKAIKTLQHQDPSMDLKIHSVLKRGFTRSGKVLRPEEVVIYKPSST